MMIVQCSFFRPSFCQDLGKSSTITSKTLTRLGVDDTTCHAGRHKSSIHPSTYLHLVVTFFPHYPHALCLFGVFFPRPLGVLLLLCTFSPLALDVFFLPPLDVFSLFPLGVFFLPPLDVSSPLLLVSSSPLLPSFSAHLPHVASQFLGTRNFAETEVPQAPVPWPSSQRNFGLKFSDLDAQCSS